MQHELLVVTERRSATNQTVNFTCRLVLPAEVIGDSLFSDGHIPRIWWAERTSDSVYLKAYLGNCRIYPRYAKYGGKQFIAVGDLAVSVCIYRVKPTCPINGVVNINKESHCWQVIELDSHQTHILLSQATKASPIVLSLQDAARINKRSLNGCWPQDSTGIIHPQRLWKIFKRSASLSELTRVNGLDPYETSVVAALIEVGAAASAKAVLQSIYSGVDLIQHDHHYRESARIGAPTFIPWNLASYDATLGQPPTCEMAPITKGLSVQHEQIVAALAFSLRSMHLTPHLSPLVDLAILHNGSALFFEVKTVEHGNLLDQVRAAVGQLLEYRFIYKGAFNRTHLTLVAAPLGPPSEVLFARDFVKDCGIDWVYWHPGSSQFKFLEEVLNRFHNGGD